MFDASGSTQMTEIIIIIYQIIIIVITFSGC